MATRHVLAELTAAFERRSRERVVVEAVGGVDAAKRVESGEAFDFVVLAAAAIDKLAGAGRIDPRSRIDVARSNVAIAVRKGARRPDVATESVLREAVLAARSVAYSTGPSGRYLNALFERWGIADTIASRTVEAPPGVPVGDLIARGDAEIGFQQLSELIHLPEIDVIGTLPAAIAEVTMFRGAVCVASAHPRAAASLLAFCASPDANEVKRRHGMEP